MSLLDGYKEQQNTQSSLLDGYNGQQQQHKNTRSLSDGESVSSDDKSLLDGYKPDNPVLEGKISKKATERQYDDRFEDRPNRFVYDLNQFKEKDNKKIGDFFKLGRSALWNIPTGFAGNAAKDVGDTVVGLAQILGKGLYQFPVKQIMRMAHLENPVTPDELQHGKKYLKSNLNSIKKLPMLFQKDENGNNAYRTHFRQDHPDIMNLKDSLIQGLKAGYGQNGIDISKNGLDWSGLAQSFYAHPINLLDLVGVGEVGKLKSVGKIANAGGKSRFSKTIGNKTVSPTYSKNLVINALQRGAESKAAQKIIDAIDKSPFRNVTDVAADFLGLEPDSRFLGSQGANVRNAKLIEQKHQTKNITERNKAFAANNEMFGGLSDVEAKELVNSIENGKTLFKPQTRDVINQKIQDFNFDNIDNNISVSGSEFGENLPLKNIQNAANEYFRQNIQGKTIQHKELGNITANSKSRLKYTSGAGSDLKYKIAPKLNEMVQTAEYIGTELPLNGKNNKFVKVHKLANKANIGGEDVNFLINVGEDTKGNLFYDIDDIIERPSFSVNSTDNRGLSLTAEPSAINSITPSATLDASNNIINDVADISTPRMREIKNSLRNKVNQNAEYYINKRMLSQQAVDDLPVNNYASIKHNKPIDSLTVAEKLDALKDIEKMPAEQKPFYIPMMFDDKLRAGDFFANTTKRYIPGELKHRGNGMGLDVNNTGGKRIYDPVELTNRLDAHRIKLENTENMINEVIENFAKPLDLSKDKVMDGYVPFNPDGFLKFYRGSIDFNQITLRKLEELGNIDTAFKAAFEESIKALPDDIKTYIGAMKNNKIYQIPEEVAQTLGYGKSKKNALGMMFDMATAGFKRKVLGTSVKWFINNRIGNGIMAGLKGVNIADYLKAFDKNLFQYMPDDIIEKSLYEAEKTIIGRTGGADNGIFGKLTRFLGGEFIDTSELKGNKKLYMQAANSLAIPGKVINTLTDKMFAFNQKFENWERRAAYIHHSNKIGKNTAFDNIFLKTTGQNIVKQDELLKHIQNNPELLSQVLKDVDNTLGDYINMTPVERRDLRRFIPFYSWLRTISRYTLSLAESDPIRANLVNKISMACNEENENLPDYQKGSIETEFNSDRTGKPLRLNYEHSIPFSTFGDTADNPVGSINPLIQGILEGALGNKFFMNRPFTSPNYENIYGGGYASLDPMTVGEYKDKLPLGERAASVLVGGIRTSVPLFEFLERVGAGSLQNLINNNELKPMDALYDTSFGGYNYKDIYKRPKGWNTNEQILRYLFPIQQEGQGKQIKKLHRQINY